MSLGDALVAFRAGRPPGSAVLSLAGRRARLEGWGSGCADAGTPLNHGRCHDATGLPPSRPMISPRCPSGRWSSRISPRCFEGLRASLVGRRPESLCIVFGLIPVAFFSSLSPHVSLPWTLCSVSWAVDDRSERRRAGRVVLATNRPQLYGVVRTLARPGRPRPAQAWVASGPANLDCSRGAFWLWSPGVRLFRVNSFIKPQWRHPWFVRFAGTGRGGPLW